MLDLIEHLAGGVRDVAILLLCLARTDLLDLRPRVGRGQRARQPRSSCSALPRGDSETLVDALSCGAAEPLSAEQRAAVLDTTEGNPLFLEETVRMLLEPGGDVAPGIPHTVQAMIAARIDRLPAGTKELLQRAAVAGRTFPAGAVSALLDEREIAGDLEELVRRDFLAREQRSAIRGEDAFRFRHGLIRDVAYASLSKTSRGAFHRRLAAWLAERSSADELVEIRAYHLDEAAQIARELEGRVPAELAADAAAALERAGRRALSREANRAARRLLAAGGRPGAHARAPLPGGPRRLAHDRHPGHVGGDGGRVRARPRGRRLPDRGSCAHGAGPGGPLPRRRPRAGARARERSARGDRRGRRHRQVRRPRDAGDDALVGRGARRSGGARRREARDRRAHRPPRPEGGRAPGAGRHAQRSARAGARAGGAGAGDRARGGERQPEEPRLGAPHGREPGVLPGAARRGGDVAPAGVRALRGMRYRAQPCARAQRARARRLEAGRAVARRGAVAGRRSACSRRCRIAARWSRASGCSPRCASSRGGWRRPSGSRCRRARPWAPTTSRRTRPHDLRSASCAPRRAGTTRPRSFCATPSRSCATPASGATRSSRSPRSPASCARGAASRRRWRSTRSSPRWRRPSRTPPALIGALLGPALYGAPARIARIAWLDASSGDSEITVAGRSKRSSASRSGSARRVPSP